MLIAIALLFAQSAQPCWMHGVALKSSLPVISVLHTLW